MINISPAHMAYALALVESIDLNEQWFELHKTKHGSKEENELFDRLTLKEREVEQLRIDYLFEKKLSQRDQNEAIEQFKRVAKENRDALENISRAFTQPIEEKERDPNESMDSDFPDVPLDPQEVEMNKASNY